MRKVTSTTDLLGPMINSIKELAQSNDQLQKANRVQKLRIDQLEHDLSQIKNGLVQLKDHQ